jgi:hypothetical protein
MKKTARKPKRYQKDDAFKFIRGRFLLDRTSKPGVFLTSSIFQCRLAACESGVDYKTIMLAKALYDLAGFDTFQHTKAAAAATASERIDPKSLEKNVLEKMKAVSQSDLQGLPSGLYISSLEWSTLVHAFGHAFGHEFKNALQTENNHRPREIKRLKKRFCHAVNYMFDTLVERKPTAPHGNALLVKDHSGKYQPLSAALLIAYIETANNSGHIPKHKKLLTSLIKKHGDATYQKEKVNRASEQFHPGPKISKIPNRTWTKMLDLAGISEPRKIKKAG